MGIEAVTADHWSDCATHNEPAYPAGACDCGGFFTLPEKADVTARYNGGATLTWLECFVLDHEPEGSPGKRRLWREDLVRVLTEARRDAK